MFWAKKDNLLQINEGIYPANKVWEGVCRNHLVCPSVHPSVRPSVCFCDRVHPYLSRRKTLEVLTSHENYLWHKDVSWFYPNVIWARSMSMEGKVQNSCPVCIFLMEKHWKFLLHAKIANDLRVCHDFDLKFKVTGRQSLS